MVANGDGAKPIWMTELGWTTTTTTCSRGTWAGQKPAGVSEAARPPTSSEAYHCLAGYPYVEAGAVVHAQGHRSAHGDELNHYGLAAHRRLAQALVGRLPLGRHAGRPAHRAVRRLRRAVADDQHAGHQRAATCRSLTISAVASDASSVARMTFQADGKEIRNFTGTDVASGKAVKLEWQGAKKLSLGPHTITVVALDPQGNTVTKSVQVTRVKTLPATLKTTHQARQGQARQGPQGVDLRARHEDRERRPVGARSASSWQQKRGKKWKTIHGGLKPANKPFTFTPEAQAHGHVARAGQATSTSRPTRPRPRPPRACASSTEPATLDCGR